MVATSDLGSDAERRGGSSPFIRTSDCIWQSLFFVRIKALVQRVAPRQTCLWSVVVCYANIRACCAIVSEKRFSPHRPSIPTIFDCNNLPSVCSRLLPPFESRCCVFDNLSRYCTIARRATFSRSSFFVRILRNYIYNPPNPPLIRRAINVLLIEAVAWRSSLLSLQKRRATEKSHALQYHFFD